MRGGQAPASLKPIQLKQPTTHTNSLIRKFVRLLTLSTTITTVTTRRYIPHHGRPKSKVRKQTPLAARSYAQPFTPQSLKETKPTMDSCVMLDPPKAASRSHLEAVDNKVHESLKS